MYKGKDRKTGYLFKELFPFGGQLEEDNRWLKISELIPWEDLERKYMSYFSDIGRPALDGRLVMGLFLLKHITGLSDQEVVNYLQENPYWQAFCGFEEFQQEQILDSSSLTKLRKRLGVKYFKEMEEMTYDLLIEKKIIKGKGLIADGTVFPENIKYPNDVGLLEDIRRWLVKNIKDMGGKINKKYRTYCRKAKQEYLNFIKKRHKSKDTINKSKKQMLQYVRRNIGQIKELIEIMMMQGYEISEKILDKLQICKKIYDQQFEMHRERKRRIKNRIVSFHSAYVRPIKRGKMGKKVEFGGKGSLSHVDGMVFLDYFSHDNYLESNKEIVKKQIENYKKKFDKKPAYFTGDKSYGNRESRNYLKQEGIKAALVPLGRKKIERSFNEERWRKNKQKERNRIEGNFGNAKQSYDLDRVRYKSKEGSEMWIRGCLLGMNLIAAAKRI